MDHIHPFMPTIVLLLIFCKVHLSEAQSSQATCACDLTQNSCDTNCCCDIDCTSVDRNAFTFCKNVDLNQDDRVCVSDQVIQISNVKYRASGTGTGLFCIYTDNYSARNFYINVQTATTVSRFNELLQTYGKSSYIPPSIQAAEYLPTSVYKYGNAILLLFESNVQGFLSFPKPSISSSQCDDQNPAGFLKDETSKCTRVINDLPSQCINDRSLDASSYYTQFKFVPGPSFLATGISYQQENVTVYASSVQASATQGLSAFIPSPVPSMSTSSFVAASASIGIPSSGSTTTTTTRTVYTLRSYNDPSLVVATLEQPLVCETSTGLQGSCSFSSPPSPTYNFSENVCKNVLRKVTYTVLYDNNSTSLNISSVNVNLVMTDVPASRSHITQEFVIKFQKLGSTSSFARSGNPGYVIGREVIAGTLVTNNQKEAINLNSDPAQWLTVVASSSATLNTCGSTSQRRSVQFGINMRTGCFISIKRSMTAGECTVIQNNIYNGLLGTFPTHVAMYGNSAVTNTADWVKILNTRPQTTPGAVSGQCTNMVLGVHFEILYADTGYFGNPQSRIIGFNVKYDTPQGLKFSCSGRYCQPGASSLETQQFEVTQSVSFVDVSTTPEAQMKPKPTFEAKAPYDFFYPFV